MIDLHTHLLPGLDDGVQTPEETAKLLQLLWKQGIKTVGATSHFFADKEDPASFLARREASVAQLPPPTEDQPEILLGAEVRYFSGIGICEEIIPLRLGNTKYILIEMPFTTWSMRMVKEICDIPQQLGLIPILAHVNRYRSKHQFPKYQKQLAQAGVLFQCNCNAFTDWKKRHWALKQFKKGTFHFLGSDCHNLDTRPPNMEQAAQIIIKKLGLEIWEQFNKNAEQLLLN